MGEREGLFSGGSRLLCFSLPLLVLFCAILVPLLALTILFRGSGEAATSRDAASLPARLAPSPRRLCFACDDEACRSLEGFRWATQQAGSGLFWDGSIDLTGDGLPEDVQKVGEQVIIHQSGEVVWRSPATWRVADLALGDPNEDGRGELLLALWKPGLDGLEPADPGKERTLRSRPFIVGYRGGEYRTLWGGSAVADPIHEVELGDIDGDGAQELIVLEGDDHRQRTVSVWRWHGWGFSLIWRSHPGQYWDLTLHEGGSVSVATEERPGLLRRGSRMTRRGRTLLILSVLVVMSVISACQGSAGGEQRGAPERLVGTEWTLVSLYGSSLIEDTEITLYFKEAYFGGRMTCNQYGGGPDSGRYTATDDGVLTLPGGLAVTVQLCSEPEGIMEQEAAYIQALRDAATYQIIDDRLEIATANGETVLVFEPQE
jgi:heat shock protein HslJ